MRRGIVTLWAVMYIAGCAAPVAMSSPTSAAPSPVALASAATSAGPAAPSAMASPSPSAPAETSSGEGGPWTLTAPLSRDSFPSRVQVHVARFGSTVLVVGSDNICTPGAAWDSSVLADVWDPEMLGWAAAPSLPRPRDRFFLAPLPNGSVLVAGGATDSGNEYPGISFISSLRLDPAGSEWLRTGDLTQARSHPVGAVLHDGRVLIAGGYYANLPDEPAMRMVRSAELFDPATETWSRTGPLNVARYGSSATTLSDGRVLVLGGWADLDRNLPAPSYGTHVPLRTAELFDPRSGEWSMAGELPLGVADAALVALPGGGALTVTKDGAFRFDVESKTWIKTSSMERWADDRSIVELADGRVLAAGGTVPAEDRPTYIAAAEIYDSASDRWVRTAQMPGRHGGGSAILLDDGSVLVVGGAVAAGLGAPSCPAPAANTFLYRPPG
jgi:hypothetical protein